MTCAIKHDVARSAASPNANSEPTTYRIRGATALLEESYADIRAYVYFTSDCAILAFAREFWFGALRGSAQGCEWATLSELGDGTTDCGPSEGNECEQRE